MVLRLRQIFYRSCSWPNKHMLNHFVHPVDRGLVAIFRTNLNQSIKASSIDSDAGCFELVDLVLAATSADQNYS